MTESLPTELTSAGQPGCERTARQALQEDMAPAALAVLACAGHIQELDGLVTNAGINACGAVAAPIERRLMLKELVGLGALTRVRRGGAGAQKAAAGYELSAWGKWLAQGLPLPTGCVRPGEPYSAARPESPDKANDPPARTWKEIVEVVPKPSAWLLKTIREQYPANKQNVIAKRTGLLLKQGVLQYWPGLEPVNPQTGKRRPGCYDPSEDAMLWFSKEVIEQTDSLRQYALLHAFNLTKLLLPHDEMKVTKLRSLLGVPPLTNTRKYILETLYQPLRAKLEKLKPPTKLHALTVGNRSVMDCFACQLSRPMAAGEPPTCTVVRAEQCVDRPAGYQAELVAERLIKLKVLADAPQPDTLPNAHGARPRRFILRDSSDRSMLAPARRRGCEHTSRGDLLAELTPRQQAVLACASHLQRLNGYVALPMVTPCTGLTRRERADNFGQLVRMGALEHAESPTRSVRPKSAFRVTNWGMWLAARLQPLDTCATPDPTPTATPALGYSDSRPPRRLPDPA